MIMRFISLLHSWQFAKYVTVGVVVNMIDITLYYSLIWGSVWYVYAQCISGAVGFLSAFFLQRQFAFRKAYLIGAGTHFMRFCILGLGNYLATSLILMVLVELLEVPEVIAKIPANASVVLWNFFLYKFFVYR